MEDLILGAVFHALRWRLSESSTGEKDSAQRYWCGRYFLEVKIFEDIMLPDLSGVQIVFW